MLDHSSSYKHLYFSLSKFALFSCYIEFQTDDRERFLILTHDVLLLEMYRWTLFLKKVENFLLVSSWREKRNGNRANLRAPTWQIKAMAADGMLHSFIFPNKGEGRGVTIWVVGKIKLVFLLFLVCTYSQVFWCPYALMCSS